MELLILVIVLGFLLFYVAYKESLNVAYRRWQAGMYLFERRLRAYEQLKNAVAPVRASGAVSNLDADQFAQAMLDMRFLFNKDLEQVVDDIYDAMVKKHVLDTLLEVRPQRDLAAPFLGPSFGPMRKVFWAYVTVLQQRPFGV